MESGTRTLKDAVNEAIRDWVTHVRDTHYLLGSALGPHPYPSMVRDFQAVIGQEARQQILAQAGRLPDACIACVGGGSNAIGLFHAFLDDLDGAADRGRSRRAGHPERQARRPLLRPAASGGRACCTARTPTCCKTRMGRSLKRIPSRPGWITPQSARSTLSCARSAAANTPMPTTSEALDAFQLLARSEGILPALESAHAVARSRSPGPAACARPDPAGQPFRARR